jgi:hypothetical protein
MPRIDSHVTTAQKKHPAPASDMKKRVEDAFAKTKVAPFFDSNRDNYDDVKNMKIPESVKKAFQDQSPGLMDGSITMTKMPFGTNNFVYVLSYQGGDDVTENQYFSKTGKAIDDQTIALD